MSLCNWCSTAIGSSAFEGRGLPIGNFWCCFNIIRKPRSLFLYPDMVYQKMPLVLHLQKAVSCFMLCSMKGHKIWVFADIPRWRRPSLQSVLLVAALLLKSCMQAMGQFNFALDLWLIERGIIVMHFIQLFIIDAWVVPLRNVFPKCFLWVCWRCCMLTACGFSSVQKTLFSEIDQPVVENKVGEKTSLNKLWLNAKQIIPKCYILLVL